MEQLANNITLRGTLHSLPEFSHENHGKRFYRFLLDVPRLSGTADRLPIVAEEAIVLSLDPFSGEMITVTGQVRSYNHRQGGTRHLLIFVFAQTLTVEEGEPINEVFLEGPLCRDPVYRRTPLGRDICDGMLAVPRTFRRADYLPCIFWGRTARYISQFHTRDVIYLRGRLQSRGYTKQTENGTEERVAYEISALEAEVAEAS